jgi:hypothetical protein
MMDKQNTPSKAEEAAHFRTLNAADDAVPSYDNHTADDLYTESIPNYGTGLPCFLDFEEETTDILDPYNELQRDPAPQEQGSIPPALATAPPPGPLSLTLDKALIFPNAVPATALYSLNYTLNTMGNSITLSRSVPGAKRTDGKSSKMSNGSSRV